MSAAQESGRAPFRWPEHMLHTAPVEQRPRTAAPRPQSAQQPARQRTPQQAAPQRTVPLPPDVRQPQARQPQQPRPPQAHPQYAQRRPPVRTAAVTLTAPQRRRRWVGAIASAVLIGGTLPVHLGAVAIESLELLSPGPDGSAKPVVLAAIGIQLVVLLLPMLAGPAIGGFTRRWRARLLVLGANAALVGLLVLVAWIRVSQL